MEKALKTEKTIEKIISGAINEFGTKGYEAGSLNTICSENGISKGLIYHNFKNKDEIYLRCVAVCFQEFIVFVRQHQIGNDLKKYLHVRYAFFEQNPMLSKVFFEAVLQPPGHLEKQIKELKDEFDQMNLEIYRLALKQMTLREGVTEPEALQYFTFAQEIFNGFFSRCTDSSLSFSAKVNEHESGILKMLDFILYGVVREEKKYD